MKILVLIDVYSKAPMGGAGTVLRETAKAFRQAGHDVLVLCRRRRDIGDYEFIDDVPFWTFAAETGGVRRAWRLLSAYRRATQAVLAGRRWDLILCHHPLPLWAVMHRLPAAIPVVSVFHSPWAEEYRVLHGDRASWAGRQVRAWIEGEALTRSARVVTLSRYMREEAAARYPALADRIDVVPGGVDLTRYAFVADPASARAALDLGIPFLPTAFWVTTVRRHVPRTGVDTLIRAVARIAADAPNLRLVVGGTGPCEAAYRTLAAEVGLSDRVFFTGFLPDEKLAALLGASDLFVLPSRVLEGFGLATLEAMAAGTPVLATPVGGIPEILDPFSPDLLAESWDDAALARALLTWYGRRERLIRLRPSCRQYVEARYGWDRVRQDLERTFAAVLAARGGPRAT